MFDWRSRAEWWQLLRYYQAGLINMAFGYALFAGLISLGTQVFVAQALSHVLGSIFNYFTYSRFAFAGQSASKVSFALSYVGNYFLGVAGLWLALKLFASPYVAGGLATAAVSLANYFILKSLVFLRGKPGSAL